MAEVSLIKNVGRRAEDPPLFETEVTHPAAENAATMSGEDLFIIQDGPKIKEDPRRGAGNT